MVFSFGQRSLSFKQPLRPLVLGGCLAFAWTVTHAQSLLQLTEQAQAHDATWQSARAQLDATIYKSEQAKAGLLPHIGIQAGSQYSDTRIRYDVAGTPMRSDLAAAQHSAAVQATQPLYNPGNYATYKQGQRNVDLGYVQIEAQSQDLLIRTAKAYFDVLAAQDNLRLVQTQKKATQEQFEYAKRNFEIGTATITDSREAQARLDLVLAQEIAALNDLQVRQAALDQLVGSINTEPWALKQPVTLPVLEPSDMASWLNVAQAQSPSVRQAQIALDLAKLETEKAQAGHKPTVDLQASYAHQRNPDGTTGAQIPMNNQRTNVGTVGVVMNIPLFSGFAVQNRIKETLSLEDKSRADLEDAKRQVDQAVRTAYFGIQSAQGQVRALEAAVASSQSALEANLLGYEVGVRINMDVLNAQSQLFQSQKELAQARYSLLLAHLQLRQAAGTLSMQDVFMINALLAPSSMSTKAFSEPATENYKTTKK